MDNEQFEELCKNGYNLTKKDKDNIRSWFLNNRVLVGINFPDEVVKGFIYGYSYYKANCKEFKGE